MQQGGKDNRKCLSLQTQSSCCCSSTCRTKERLRRSNRRHTWKIPGVIAKSGDLCAQNISGSSHKIAAIWLRWELKNWDFKRTHRDLKELWPLHLKDSSYAGSSPPRLSKIAGLPFAHFLHICVYLPCMERPSELHRGGGGGWGGGGGRAEGWGDTQMESSKWSDSHIQLN